MYVYFTDSLLQLYVYFTDSILRMYVCVCRLAVLVKVDESANLLY